MFIIAYIAILFMLLRFLVSLINLISWPFLPKAKPSKYEPLVSILIPARNEENNIENIIRCLTNQNYNNYEVIIYDDQSEDKTLEIIKKNTSNNKKLKYIEGHPLPEGWTGKNFACFNLAKKAKGDFLLFLDADVLIKGDIISKSVHYMLKEKLNLLSIFPKQQIKSIGERTTVPIVNWILLSLLPLFLVKKCSWVSFSAANGQFMMFEANNYKKHNWHSLVKNHIAEDIAIARKAKRLKYKTSTLLGNKEIQCRMYKEYNEAINGFTKNIIQMLSNSYLFAIVFTIFSTFGWVIVWIYFGYLILLIYLMTGLFLHIITSISSKQNVFKDVISIVPKHLSFLIIIYNALITSKRNKRVWKGRLLYTEKSKKSLSRY